MGTTWIREPVLIISGFFALFLVLIVVGRLDLSVVKSEDETKKELKVKAYDYFWEVHKAVSAQNKQFKKFDDALRSLNNYGGTGPAKEKYERAKEQFDAAFDKADQAVEKALQELQKLQQSAQKVKDLQEAQKKRRAAQNDFHSSIKSGGKGKDG